MRFLSQGKPYVDLVLCQLVVVNEWKIWHTASLYHLVHTAALVAAPVTKRPNVVSSPALFHLQNLVGYIYVGLITVIQ